MQNINKTIIRILENWTHLFNNRLHTHIITCHIHILISVDSAKKHGTDLTIDIRSLSEILKPQIQGCSHTTHTHKRLWFVSTIQVKMDHQYTF